MFTMAKIKDGGTYLENHLSANDYYAEGEKVIGHWQGKGAERLELSGEILPGDAAFAALRDNRHPDTGEKLTPRDGENRIRFLDFQCSAQKSVSIIAVTLGDERLLAAHDRASATAFVELEKFAACRGLSRFPVQIPCFFQRLAFLSPLRFLRGLLCKRSREFAKTILGCFRWNSQMAKAMRRIR